LRAAWEDLSAVDRRALTEMLVDKIIIDRHPSKIDKDGRRHYLIRAIPTPRSREEAARLKAVHEARVKIVPRVWAEILQRHRLADRFRPILMSERRAHPPRILFAENADHHTDCARADDSTQPKEQDHFADQSAIPNSDVSGIWGSMKDAACLCRHHSSPDLSMTLKWINAVICRP
jgi:hypothetical protein